MDNEEETFIDAIPSVASQMNRHDRMGDEDFESYAASQLYAKKKYYLASLSCWFGAITMGVSAGFTSPTIPQLIDQKPFYLPLDNDFKGWFGSLMPLGALFGGLAAGQLVF